MSKEVIEWGTRLTKRILQQRESYGSGSGSNRKNPGGRTDDRRRKRNI